MKPKEKFYDGKDLKKAWDKVDDAQRWWFDLMDAYSPEQTLDGSGIPIITDEGEFSADDIRESTGDNICVVVLGRGPEKVMALINRDLPCLFIVEAASKTITWADYAKEGLRVFQKGYPNHILEGVVVNPKISTLEQLGILSPIIGPVVSRKLVGQLHKRKGRIKRQPQPKKEE